MDNYNMLLKEISEFLETEEIKNNDETISLYSLYSIMKEEFVDLDKLSNIDKTISQKLNTFRKFLLGRYDDFFIKNHSGVDIYADEFVSKITFSNATTSDTDDFYKISLIKEKNKKELYLDKKMDWHNKQICKFIKNNFELLLDTLLNIEKYYELIGKTSNKENDINEFSGSNILFDYNIYYNKNGWIKMYSGISKNHPLYNECDKHYLSQQSINEFIEDKNNDILKRIPILVSDLPVEILNIYNKGKEDKKDKELIKKIKWWN